MQEQLQNARRKRERHAPESESQCPQWSFAMQGAARGRAICRPSFRSRNALNGLSQCRGRTGGSRRCRLAERRNALNGLSQCRDAVSSSELPSPSIQSQCPQWSFAMQGPRRRPPCFGTPRLLHSRNALNGLSQCRARRQADAATGAEQSQCPQWSFAMQGRTTMHDHGGSSEVAMPSMVFRNAGVDELGSRSRPSQRGRNALNGLSQCRADQTVDPTIALLEKSQCPQWSFAMQVIQACRARNGLPMSDRVAMPSMVFRNAGDQTDPHGRLAYVEQVAMPSMVFRNAGCAQSRRTCASRQESRNALNGLSQCRGGPSILLYRNSLRPRPRG